MRLTDIFRHPVKGLAPEPLLEAELSPNHQLPGDRLFALAHELSDFDFDRPAWIRRKNFVVVALSPKLATIETRFVDESSTLEITQRDGSAQSFDLQDEDDQRRLAEFIESFSGAAQPGPYQLASVPGRHLTDHDTLTLSLANWASHDAMVESTGIELSPRRWRCNLWVNGLPPWQEFELLGQSLRVGEAVLTVEERLERCAATSANTITGDRDIDMVRHLETQFGHHDFGILVSVKEAGTIRPGDNVEILG